jgi:F-type H+-transporting ATPase subunit b
MLIDWFTVCVQIINFLILIALLKRFLYGPVLRAMDEREQTIANRLAKAAAAQKEAEKKAALLAKDQEDFAMAKNQMESEALSDITNWKDASIERIKEEIAAKHSTWQKNIAEEEEAFLQKLKIHISRQVFLVAQKAMTELADTSLEDRLLETFLLKMQQEEDIQIVKNIPPSVPLQMTTGFPLANSQKETFQRELASFFSSSASIDFSEDTSLGFGVRLLAGDRKWEWNLSRYMRDIEKDIIDRLSTMTREK